MYGNLFKQEELQLSMRREQFRCCKYISVISGLTFILGSYLGLSTVLEELHLINKSI
jgi:hypothetical protein